MARQAAVAGDPVQAIAADAFGQVIGQGQGEQLTHPLHGMLADGDR